MLKAEIAALEAELADPSNPLLHRKDDPGYVDPGELIRGLVDVKGRLQKISKVREGRGRLVSVMMEDEEPESEEPATDEPKTKVVVEEKSVGVRSIAELDQRVGELETVVGSSSTTLDEVSSFALPRLYSRILYSSHHCLHPCYHY
jgi:nuclear migration protein JNM1